MPSHHHRQAATSSQDIEAALWILLPVIKGATPDAVGDIPIAVELCRALLSLPADSHPQLKQTAVKMVAALHTWAGVAGGAHTVSALVEFVLATIASNPDLIGDGVSAIELFCKDATCATMLGRWLSCQRC